MRKMETDPQSLKDLSNKWQWLIIPLVILVSFSCVFIATQGALIGDSERVINADMLANSNVSYHFDPGDQLKFAPMSSNVILEASEDAAKLKITLIAPTENIPLTNRITPTNSPTSHPINHQIGNQPTKTEFTKTTSIPPKVSSIPPTITPLPPTKTFRPATATATNTPTLSPTVLPSFTPTATATATSTAPKNLIPPTQTPSQTSTSQPPDPTKEPKPTKELKPTKEPKPTKVPKPTKEK